MPYSSVEWKASEKTYLSDAGISRHLTKVGDEEEGEKDKEERENRFRVPKPPDLKKAEAYFRLYWCSHRLRKCDGGVRTQRIHKVAECNSAETERMSLKFALGFRVTLSVYKGFICRKR